MARQQVIVADERDRFVAGTQFDVRRDLVVTCTKIRRAFGDRVVLDDVNIEIQGGEFVALLGRSGTGKSTLLRALAGLDDGIEGRAVVPERRAVVFQDARLLPWARVLENVTLGLRGPDARERGRAALQEVELAGHERDWPKTLSGGEAQRVALAARWCENRRCCCSTSRSVRSTR